MLFKSPLHRAVMTHVKTKIKAAEQDYQTKLARHEQSYAREIQSTEEALKVNKILALEESIQAVIKQLTT